MRVLLLSDLHLPVEPDPLRETFIRFLEGPARDADRVYILGDLFEYWVGDDVGLQTYAREASRLAALTALGVEVGFMRGNRDFFVGHDFATVTGVKILGDPAIVELPGGRTLLSHGDLFCTDDTGYQRWRRFAHNPLAQKLFLLLPQALRQRIAARLRRSSAQGKQRKDMTIMDVNAQAVAQAFKRHDVRRIIHGHTHRPADHVDAAERRRIVLADWRPQRMEYLELDGASMRRVNFSSAAKTSLQ